MSEENRSNRFWLGFFLGGLIGAVTLFFIGTKEGKKTQKFLKKKSEDVLEDLEGKIADYKEKGKELVSQSEELKEEVIEKIEEQKGKMTQEMSKQLDSALSHIEELQERGRKTTEDLRKKLTFKNIPKKN